MKQETKYSFYISVPRLCINFAPINYFTSIEEVLKDLSNCDARDFPFKTICFKKDIVYSLEEPQISPQQTLFNPFHTNPNSLTETVAKFEYVLSDKIFYKKDLQEYLKSHNWPLPKTELNPEIPATITYLSDFAPTRMIPTSKHYPKLRKTIRSADWANLDPNKDKIVDFKLHEIWPNKTNNIPTELCNMLNIKQK